MLWRSVTLEKKIATPRLVWYIAGGAAQDLPRGHDVLPKMATDPEAGRRTDDDGPACRAYHYFVPQ